MLTSFADLVALSPHSYTRPLLQNDGPLVVKAGRHPVISVLPQQQLASSFVTNDLFLSPLENLHIITGPNGSGKVHLALRTQLEPTLHLILSSRRCT
jgi:DNA mismatch repair protein MutS